MGTLARTAGHLLFTLPTRWWLSTYVILPSGAVVDVLGTSDPYQPSVVQEAVAADELQSGVDIGRSGFRPMHHEHLEAAQLVGKAALWEVSCLLRTYTSSRMAPPR